MPIYEYKCDACGARFEQIQKFSDPPIDVCPTCGERKVHKLLSSPAIQFKGSGWYITDYARAKDAKASGESKESGKSEEAGKSADAKESGTPGKSKESGESKEAKSSKESDKSAESKSTAATSAKDG